MPNVPIEFSLNKDKVIKRIEELTTQYNGGFWSYSEYISKMYVITEGQRIVIINSAKEDLKLMGQK